MKRSILAAVVASVVALPLCADVTIKQSVSGTGMAAAGSGTTTTYIKGNKMRNEVSVNGNTLTTIYDVDNQKMYTFDSKKKNADVWDMDAFSEEMSKSVTTGDIKSSVTPNGKKKDVGGKPAAGYDFKVTVPAKMGGQEGMEMTVNLTGPIWIVKGAPGASDYMNFYKGAVEKGWIFSDPRAAKGSPGQAKAMAEMYRQLAATGGLPYETEMKISVTGEGPMAALLARMGNMTMTSTVESIETWGLDDALFAPPAGYKVTTKK
jgi:hypothetical protein